MGYFRITNSVPGRQDILWQLSLTVWPSVSRDAVKYPLGEGYNPSVIEFDLTSAHVLRFGVQDTTMKLYYSFGLDYSGFPVKKMVPTFQRDIPEVYTGRNIVVGARAILPEASPNQATHSALTQHNLPELPESEPSPMALTITPQTAYVFQFYPSMIC